MTKVTIIAGNKIDDFDRKETYTRFLIKNSNCGKNPNKRT